jgi:hypothetical protein
MCVRSAASGGQAATFTATAETCYNGIQKHQQLAPSYFTVIALFIFIVATQRAALLHF